MLSATGYGSAKGSEETKATVQGAAPGAGAPDPTIALLLPETKTTRYESADRPYFEAKFRSLCGSCEIIYSNANQDAAAQQQQAEAALTNGAQVLVLDPVDSVAAAVMAEKPSSSAYP